MLHLKPRNKDVIYSLKKKQLHRTSTDKFFSLSQDCGAKNRVGRGFRDDAPPALAAAPSKSHKAVLGLPRTIGIINV